MSPHLANGTCKTLPLTQTIIVHSLSFSSLVYEAQVSLHTKVQVLFPFLTSIPCSCFHNLSWCDNHFNGLPTEYLPYHRAWHGVVHIWWCTWQIPCWQWLGYYFNWYCLQLGLIDIDPIMLRAPTMPLSRIPCMPMDGNFTAVHQHHTLIDIKLTHGEFYMTEPHWYKAHLTITKEIKEVCYPIYHSTFPLIQQ